MRKSEPPVIGIMEVAAMINASANYVGVMRARGALPPEDWSISNRPVWLKQTILQWGRDTGRLTGDGQWVAASTAIRMRAKPYPAVKANA